MLTNLVRPILSSTTKRLLRFGEESVPLALAPEPGRTYLLYIHIPFCTYLCPYCSFHRVKYDADLAARYFEALRAEIRHYASRGFRFSDVYVGGGTPTVNLEELTKTLKLVRELFPINSISVETNPDHLHQETFDALLTCGVNRLSVGVQSFNDRLLGKMGRLQHYGSGHDIASRLWEAEGIFPTLNVDMIFNLPGQTESELQEDITRFLDTGAGQVSFYPLMMSDSTRHRVDEEMGHFSHAKEEELYYQIVDALAPTHKPASVWCFSRDSQQIDEYIVDHPEFVGVGSGAFSYLKGVFYATSFSILKYDQFLSEHLAEKRTGITRVRSLSAWEQRYYQLLTGLFGRNLSVSQVEQIYGDAIPVLLKVFCRLGIVRQHSGGYELTRRGAYYWLVAMSEFLSGVNNLRDQMRAHIREEMVASYGEAVPIRVRQR